MQALLDTHALLWWLTDDPALPERPRLLIAEKRNSIFVSSATAWEIAIKVRTGKLPQAAELALDFAGYIARQGFEMLNISAEHAIRAGLLGGDHKDPFDRMLIAQSQAENLALVTNELLFERYGVWRIW